MDINREKAKKIININLKNIGKFCINNCKAQCCQRGALVLLDKKELEIIAGNKVDFYIKNKTISQNNVTHYYYYNLTKSKCQHLNKDFICKIHSKKPRVCSDYPIFIVNNYIVTANDCLAIKEDLLDNCFKELKKLGYIII